MEKCDKCGKQMKNIRALKIHQARWCGDTCEKTEKKALDPAIQCGILPRYHSPQRECPTCGGNGRIIDTKSNYHMHRLERFFECPLRHSWVETREMGTK